MPGSRSRATAAPAKPLRCSLRGTESNHTVVLIDGVRINPGTIGGAALQNIAPESLERIEIVKGPRSSLYGTDAIGGVVQLFTRGAAKDGVSAGATFGSDSTQQMFGDAALSARRQVQVRLRRQLRARATACRCSSTTTPIAAIAMSPAAHSPSSPRPTRSRSARAAGAPPDAPNIPRRPSAIRRTRPPRRISRTACIRSKANTASRADSVCAPRSSRALDDIEQLQAGFGPAEFDYARTRRTNVDVQVDLAHDRHACVQPSACSTATRTRARNRSARCSTKTRA